jgi:hypothetical protein
MSRAIYGHIAGEVKAANLGDVIHCRREHVSAVRNAGYLRGKVFELVAIDGEQISLKRVRRTRWGRNKARAVAMKIGSTVKVSSEREYNRLYKGALYAGVKITCQQKPGGGFKITRIA